MRKMPWSRPNVWSFAERCLEARAPGDIERAFFSEIERLGFLYGGIISLPCDGCERAAGAVRFVRAPAAWLARYEEAWRGRTNPIHAAARRRALPFFWKSAAFNAGLDEIDRRYMAEQSEAGVVGGFTVPMHGPGIVAASCSLVPGPDELAGANFLVGHSMAVLAHESARRLLDGDNAQEVCSLTQQERECLRYVAGGKSDWAISEVMGLRERAVHRAIERAKTKLGVATRVQAVVRALQIGAVLIDDAAQ